MMALENGECRMTIVHRASFDADDEVDDKDDYEGDFDDGDDDANDNDDKCINAGDHRT